MNRVIISDQPPIKLNTDLNFKYLEINSEGFFYPEDLEEIENCVFQSIKNRNPWIIGGYAPIWVYTTITTFIMEYLEDNEGNYIDPPQWIAICDPTIVKGAVVTFVEGGKYTENNQTISVGSVIPFA